MPLHLLPSSHLEHLGALKTYGMLILLTCIFLFYDYLLIFYFSCDLNEVINNT